MSDVKLLATLEMIAAVAESPVSNPLEVGFRHSPLSPKEIQDRQRDSFEYIAAMARELIREMKPNV